MQKIFIDPGHGGTDSGATNGNLIEKDMNLTTSFACRDKLKQYGFDVKMSRETDVYLGLTERADSANAWGADLFICIHYNAGGGDRGEVIYSVYGGAGKDIAQFVKQELMVLGQTDVKDYSKPSTSGVGDYFTVISATHMPALILEGCFIDNATDRQIADTPEKQKTIGETYANAIAKFYGVATEEQKFSYDTTVDNMIKDGVTDVANMGTWEQKLAGNAELKKEEVRTIFDRYHAKVK